MNLVGATTILKTPAQTLPGRANVLDVQLRAPGA